MYTKDSPSLRSCPFCGAEATAHHYPFSYHICCENENCAVKPSFGKSHDNADERGFSELVKAWNTRAELGSGTCEKDQLEAALALSRGMVDMAARREIYKDNRIADLEQLVRDMYDVAARGEFDVGEESKFSERMTKLGVVSEC